MAMTVDERLAAFNGIGPGFDHLRVGLSLFILTWHSFSISYGQDYAHTLPIFPVQVLLAGLLPMFFALSGFLVMGSALRTGELKTFLAFRVLRIVPALWTEITISALILGPLLTVLPLSEYFTHPMFWEYFGSLVGRVRFELPGLFVNNPAPELVNFALWTVGPEILCYVVLALLMLTGWYRRPKVMVAVTLAYLALALFSGVLFPATTIGEVLPSKILLFSFLVGNLFYLFRARIPFSVPLGMAAFVAALLLVYASQVLQAEAWSYLAVPGFTYACVVIGLSPLPRMPFFHRGDYSYGIYIYGFPIQQAVAHFLPQYREWYVNLAIALPVTLLFAVFSWHAIEKPALSLRKRILAAKPAEPLRPEKTFNRKKLAAFVALSLYGLFVVDASNVLPMRSGAKMILYGFGLYEYDENDERPQIF